MKSPLYQIERERALAGADVPLDSVELLGSRRKPREKKGAQMPSADVLALPDVVELTREEVEQMRAHQRKALTEARRAASCIGADHSHSVRMHVESAQREIRAAFDVLDRAVKRARKGAK